MTKIKMLVATLVLGSSAAAFAAPTATVIQSRPVAPTATIVVNAAPVVATVMPARDWQNKQWKQLVASTKVSGRDTIYLGGRGRYDQLKLQSLGGSTSLTKLQIKFADGTSETVRLNNTLDRASGELGISLGGEHKIASITLVGSSNRRGALEILGA
jgi:hypothetical protein